MAGIAHVITPDSASGAQVIDGSLKFETSKTQYLKRTPSSSGNTKTWTFSCWIKRDTITATHYIFRTPSADQGFYISASDDKIDVYRYSGSFTYLAKTQQALRDVASGWYHIVYVHDSTAAAGSRLKIYINNVLHSLSITTDISSGAGYSLNTAVEHRLGEINGRMSQAYFIDGQTLTPSEFGFTDPLTNTWKPKKYTGTFTATLPGKSETDTYADSARFTSYETFGTVTENDTGYTLPSSSWSHYGGKVKELDTGGFQIVTVNSATTDFFMGCWVKFETYATDRQIGINNFGNYVYWETQSNGAVGVRHNGGSRHDSSATDLNDGNWHHIALSRTGGTLYGFVDGTAVISTTSGVSGNSVGANSQFWFFGGSGTAYNIDGQVIDPFVYIGQGLTSYTKPTSPLIDSSGSVNSLFGINSSYLYYARISTSFPTP